ncbi:hypothetical protein EGW08_017386 [Elysia chlorotica]|uniref:Hexosyltransferase n=1 Tax=Elysia chlorotica TaxID=188477 RepID=A0A3S0ZTE9_ELYCH|nr:hypothetical protein EGW08_017386 [Elysia chlorotica]
MNRSYAALLGLLLVAVFFVNLFIYKYVFGLGLSKAGDEDFDFSHNLSQTSLRPDVLRAAIWPAVSCAGRDVELVLCVPVKRNGFDRRAAVRITWGSYGKYGGRSTEGNGTASRNNHSSLVIQTKNGTFTPGEIILVFFIGSADSLSDENGEQKRIEREAKTYGDIFQDTYIDTYKNLTLKSISIINWISKNCPNARYAAKIDDDMYVNIPYLLSRLRDHAKKTSAAFSSPPENILRAPPPFLVGAINYGASVIRNKKNKWYTSKEAYQDELYPNYLSGTAYAMSGSAAPLLYEASLRIPLFWMEDIFITGMCAKVARVQLIPDAGFNFFKIKPEGCSFRTTISGHRYTIAQLKSIHKELHDPSLKCK